MFERFTDRARRSVALAQEHARLMGHQTIHPAHLLIGILEEGDNLAAKILKERFTADMVRKEIFGADVCGVPAIGHLPFVPETKKVLELSLREALQLGHNFIAPEHLLLAILRQGALDKFFKTHPLTLDEARLAVTTTYKRTAFMTVNDVRDREDGSYVTQILLTELRAVEDKIQATEIELRRLNRARSEIYSHLQFDLPTDEERQA